MPTKVNADLDRERRNATFDVNELSNYIYGGSKIFARKKYIERLVYDDPEFSNGRDYNFLERHDVYSEGIRRTMHMVKRVKELGLHDPYDLYWFRSAVFPNENAPTDLHLSMFVPTLMSQGSAEQQEQWLLRSFNWEIIGSYAQTELGHGTFLRGLETTATYDEQREEFVLHSPTLTATKWWPGGLGKTSNFAVVMADLRIKGKSHGMAAFILQLRDLETHRPLKGITLGDIGPKFGYSMIDNGFLRMDHVRIPRTNMLMKNSQVLKDGTYVKSKHAKLGYGTMLFIRAMIVADISAKSLAQAAVISTRYSCVRRQSELKPGAPEPQVLDYQTQQYKVFPELAAAYAYIFAGYYMSTMYTRTNNQILQGDIGKLPEMHALSACMKALSTTAASSGIEVCRLACGGHGYSHASGLPKLFVNAVAAVTYEGENTVMFLQTARYLVKMQAAARAGHKLAASVAYLGDSSTPCRLDSTLNMLHLAEAFQHRARRLVRYVTDELTRLGASGVETHNAWNSCSVNLTKAAQAHAQCFTVLNFIDSVRAAPPGGITAALTDLCQLYAVHLIIEHLGDFLQDGYLSTVQASQVSDAELALLASIRPNAVALVDAFGFDDRFLLSVLGRYDGNVYENMYKWAQESPLNEEEVHPSFDKYMKPFRQASKL